MKRAIFNLLLLLFQIHSLAQLPGYLQKSGPKNINEYSFVNIHIIRENEPDDTYWYGMEINGHFTAKISDSCKYTIRFPVAPLTFHFSYAQEKDIQILSPKSEEHYYFKVSCIRKEASKQEAITSFVQLPDEEGKKLFETARLKTVFLDYPEQLDIDVILSKKDIKAYSRGRYWGDSVYQFNLRYPFPIWLQNLLRHPTGDFFTYANPPLSKTYSEYLRIMPVDFKNINSEEEMKEFVDKKFKDGKAFSGKKDKLVSWEPVTIETPGKYTSAYYSSIEDHATPLKGSESFLERKALHVIFYTYSEKGDKGLIWYLEYSIRGGQKELWTKEEMLLRVNNFMKQTTKWL